jgi:hypothetical protein
MVNVKRSVGVRKLEYHKDDDIWLMGSNNVRKRFNIISQASFPRGNC